MMVTEVDMYYFEKKSELEGVKWKFNYQSMETLTQSEEEFEEWDSFEWFEWLWYDISNNFICGLRAKFHDYKKI